jgi:hypothetical protein
MLVNHRSMLEVALLEQQIEEMRQLLASERAIPLPLLTTGRKFKISYPSLGAV